MSKIFHIQIYVKTCPCGQIGKGGSLKRSDYLLVRIRAGAPCRYNSVVECHVANVDVVGSNPTTCSRIMSQASDYWPLVDAQWLRLGSFFCIVSLMVKRPPYKWDSGGSIPSRCTNAALADVGIAPV